MSESAVNVRRRSRGVTRVDGLVRWAIGQPDVARVVAETEWANPASVRVPSKAGFGPGGLATAPGGARFEFVGGV